MARREIDAFWDRKMRNNLNENFKELYDKDDNIQQQVNDLVLESGGDSNLEVVQARGGYRVLNDRLDAVDSQLAQKANQSRAEELEERLNDVIAGLDGTKDFYTPIGLEEYLTTQGEEWVI